MRLGSLGVTRVLTHSEKAAAYMADGYARISHRPGICAAQSVGAANLAAGLQDAWLGHSPVVALTGRKPITHQHRNAYQEIAHAPLFAPVTKFSAMVQTAADLPRLLHYAWRTALSATPRPVHLDLDDLMAATIEQQDIFEPILVPRSPQTIPLYRPSPAPDEIAEAVASLNTHSKISIVAGTGARLSGAGPALIRLAEKLGAPVGVSIGAYGIVPTNHRHFIGSVGSYSAAPANQILHEADLILFVGCDTSDQVTHGWRVPDPDKPIVQIDDDPLELSRNYRNTIALMGDPKSTLTILAESSDLSPKERGFMGWARSAVDAWRQRVEPLRLSDEAPVRVERLCAEISGALPKDGILVADTGYSGVWTSTLVDLNSAGQTYLRAAGSLGWGFPASLGVKCATPERVVVCFCGDGGFYYHLPELETAKRLGIAVVVVVNNNSGLGQGWPEVRSLPAAESCAAAEMAMFRPTNFASIARDFGLTGIRVESPREIRSALRNAIEAAETVVVDVATDIEARAPRAWAPN